MTPATRLYAVAMTHKRENHRVVVAHARFRSARSLWLCTGLGVALTAFASPADAQVTRSFIAVKNPLWSFDGNWSPFGVPTAIDLVRFSQGGDERLVQLTGDGEFPPFASVKMITVAPASAQTAQYRFDLGEGRCSARRRTARRSSSAGAAPRPSRRSRSSAAT